MVEILGVQNKPHNAEIVENGSHISMGQDANENTPLISDVTTKVVNHESKMYFKVLSINLLYECILSTKIHIKCASQNLNAVYNSSQVIFFTGLWYKILHCFSMIRNVKWIMNTNAGKSDLTYLHGIRVLSLFWIILFHVNSLLLGLFPIGKYIEVVLKYNKCKRVQFNFDELIRDKLIFRL